MTCTSARMSSDGLARVQVKSTILAKLAPWLLAISSTLIGILLVELFCWLFVPSLGWNIPGRDHRVVFFDGDDSIFENHGDIFTYLPRNTIRNVLAVFSPAGFTVEYDYRFRTNNLGLTQDADIVPGRKSLLLLGDSFTEGQGAEPWFRTREPNDRETGVSARQRGGAWHGFPTVAQTRPVLGGQKHRNPKGNCAFHFR